MRVLAVVFLVATGCVSSETVECSSYTCPSATVCDEVHAGCVQPQQLKSCAERADGSLCGIDAEDDGICDQQVCVIERCGDGYIRGGEQCDGDAIPDDVDCLDLNAYVSAKPTCTADCTFDVTSCSQRCGDDILQDQFEVCEMGTEVRASCVDFGFGAGNLGCVNCGPETTRCIPFGWQLTNVPALITGIHGTSATDVYAVVTATKPLIHFDGATWSDVDVTGCGFGANDFPRHVWTPSPGLVFMAGGAGVYRLMNGTCTKWTVGAGEIASLWAFSATEAWISVGLDGVYRFDGATWTQKIALSSFNDTPIQVLGMAPNDVYALSRNGNLRRYDGLAFGAPFVPPGAGVPQSMWNHGSDLYVGSTLPGGVYRYDGQNWTTELQTLPILAGGTSLVIAGTTNGGKTYALVQRTSPQRIYMLVNDDGNWINLEVPIPTNSAPFLPPLWAAPSGEVFTCAGDSPKVITMTGSVRVDLPGPGDVFPQALAARDSGTVFAAFTNNLEAWDGLAWATQPSVAAIDVDISPTGTAFAIHNNNGLHIQPEGVGSWSQENIFGTHLVALSDTDVWMIDGSVVQRRHGVGNVETVTLPTLPSSYYLADLWGTSATNMYVVGEQVSGQSLLPLILHYGAAGWQELTIPVAIGPIETIRGMSATDIYLTGTSGGVVHYDGSAWAALQGLPAPVADIWGSPNDLFIATPSGVFHFDGTVWAPVAVGNPVGVRRLLHTGSTLSFIDSLGEWHQLYRSKSW